MAGSFFDSKSIPKCDVVILKAILHDWNDEDCIKILKSAREALKNDESELSGGGGEVIVCEMKLPEVGKSDPSQALAFNSDLWMMMFGGKERT